MLWKPPAATATTFARPDTATGTDRSVVVPSPSCPSLLAPHAITVPSPSSARLWSSPAEIATIPLSPLTATGLVLQGTVLKPADGQVSGPVVVPSPSWPYSLSPHATTVPLERSASACGPSAEIAM